MKCGIALLLVAGVAHAGPFDALTAPNASWTYDVLDAKSGKPKGEQVVLTVDDVKTQGAYTYVHLKSSSNDEYAMGRGPHTLLIGPDGLREVMNIGDEANRFSEDNLRTRYTEEYVPWIYVPAKLKPQTWSVKLDRFAQDDRVYKLKGSVTKVGHRWRTVLKGTFVIPEVEEKGSEKFESKTELDPDRGLTLICAGGTFCLRLAK